jgi:hypothetical protein
MVAIITWSLVTFSWIILLLRQVHLLVHFHQYVPIMFNPSNYIDLSWGHYAVGYTACSPVGQSAVTSWLSEKGFSTATGDTASGTCLSCCRPLTPWPILTSSSTTLSHWTGELCSPRDRSQVPGVQTVTNCTVSDCMCACWIKMSLTVFQSNGQGFITYKTYILTAFCWSWAANNRKNQ